MSLMPVRLKQLREDQNTSQEDIAAAAGVSQATWSAWEKETPKQFEVLARVARKYRISANYLLGLNDDPTLDLNTAAGDSRTIAELHTVALEMSDVKQCELLAIARTLHELEQQTARRRRRNMAVYDQVMDRLEEIAGEDAMDALESALRAGDTARTNRLLDAFFVGLEARVRISQETLEKEHDDI